MSTVGEHKQTPHQISSWLEKGNGWDIIKYMEIKASERVLMTALCNAIADCSLVGQVMQSGKRALCPLRFCYGVS